VPNDARVQIGRIEKCALDPIANASGCDDLKSNIQVL
jgi:hypothetical protein